MDYPDTPYWIMKLAARPDFVRSNLPYIPIELENIVSYTMLADYTANRIKTIETIGILKPIGPISALLLSTAKDSKTTLKLTIENLRSEYAYPTEGNSICNGLRNAWDAVKVFGTLATRNGEIVLDIDYIVKIEDLKDCENTLAMTARLARTKYKMYDGDFFANEQLQNYIDGVRRREDSDQGG